MGLQRAARDTRWRLYDEVNIHAQRRYPGRPSSTIDRIAATCLHSIARPLAARGNGHTQALRVLWEAACTGGRPGDAACRRRLGLLATAPMPLH